MAVILLTVRIISLGDLVGRFAKENVHGFHQRQFQ